MLHLRAIGGLDLRDESDTLVPIPARPKREPDPDVVPEVERIRRALASPVESR